MVEIVRRLRKIPVLKDVKIAIIGGLTVLKHLPESRPTSNVDIYVKMEDDNEFEGIHERPYGVPDVLKKRLASNHPNMASEEEFLFGINLPAMGDLPEERVAINFVPDYIVNSIGSSGDNVSFDVGAKPIKEINRPCDIPHLFLLDLIAIKINSCGMRSDDQKRDQDVADADELAIHLESGMRPGTIQLSSQQRQLITAGLNHWDQNSGKNFYTYLSKKEAWWRTTLNL